MKKKKTILKTRFLHLEGVERNDDSSFRQLADTIEVFKMELLKALRIPQIAEWIYKRLS